VANPNKAPVVPDYFDDTVGTEPELPSVKKESPEPKKGKNRRQRLFGKTRKSEEKPAEASKPDDATEQVPDLGESSDEETVTEEPTKPKRRFFFFGRGDKEETEEFPEEQPDPAEEEEAAADETQVDEA